MRIFVDANVIVMAAAAAAGRSLALFRLAEKGHCTLCASSHVVEEARRNLATKREVDSAAVDRLVQSLDRVPEAPGKLVAWAAGHGLDGNDAPVLAAAVVAQADILATGDRSHFGGLFGRELGGVTVLPLCESLGRVLDGTEA